MLNEKLLEVMGANVTQEQAFAHANDVLKNAVGGDIHKCSDSIHIPGLVNVYFEDVKTVMREPGKAAGCAALVAITLPQCELFLGRFVSLALQARPSLQALLKALRGWSARCFL